MTKQPDFYLFTDGSADTINKNGVGAYLLLSSLEDLPKQVEVKTKKFQNTSSTKLEIEALIWALSDNELQNKKVVVYTDSQNIVGLPGRRIRLEKNNFISKNGKELKNKELYIQYYKLFDLIDLQILKIKGHKATKEKSDLDRIFSLVDKAARKQIRESW